MSRDVDPGPTKFVAGEWSEPRWSHSLWSYTISATYIALSALGRWCAKKHTKKQKTTKPTTSRRLRPWVSRLQLTSCPLVVCVLSRVWLCLCDLWTVARQASLSMEFFQARMLQWVAISFFKGFSWPRDQTCVSYISCFGGQVLYHRAIWEARLACPLVKLF